MCVKKETQNLEKNKHRDMTVSRWLWWKNLFAAALEEQGVPSQQGAGGHRLLHGKWFHLKEAIS